jgi:hypothetical protein
MFGKTSFMLSDTVKNQRKCALLRSVEMSPIIKRKGHDKTWQKYKIKGKKSFVEK